MDLRNKRIVVTGGTGFLGRHVISRLRKADCTNVFVPRRAEFDLTREADIRRLINLQRPEVVFHLAAAVGGIGANERNPATFFYDNLLMGCQLMEHCRRAGTEKFVTAGTTCSYPRSTPIPFRECDLWDGYPEGTTAPYGLAKKMLIVQADVFARQYGFTAVHLLLTNLYGPGDHYDPDTSHVIPGIIHRCVEARENREELVMLWGTGRATREFLYVEDAARALHLAAERLETPEPVNVGSGQEIPIAHLARVIADKVGFEGEIRFDPRKPDGQPRRRLDLTRARELLGFEPSVDLEEGLERTIAAYEASRRPAHVIRASEWLLQFPRRAA